MNKKKLIGNLLLIAFVVGLSFTFLKPKPSDRTYQEQIQAFILEKLEQDGEQMHYAPLSFEEVNEAFLLSQKDVSTSMDLIKDTIRNQLDLMREQYVSEEVNQLIYQAEEQLEALNLTTVADYLTIDARLKRSIKKADVLAPHIRAGLYQEESRMLEAVNQLSSALSQFNLSVFNLDFEQAETIHYYHTFRLTDNQRATDHRAVFELSKEKKDILSFKEI
ncbi:MAG: hypothetical protein Roseis2KO_36690 [Roseivirga sp.]